MLENARIPVTDGRALQSLPSEALSGAYQRGGTSVRSASEPLQMVSDALRSLLHSYLQSKVNVLLNNEKLQHTFPNTLKT